jgi:uncharacterized MnhB-related membrane protein
VSAVRVSTIEPKLLNTVQKDLPGVQLVSGTPGRHFLLVVEARKALSAANVALAELLIGAVRAPRVVTSHMEQPGLKLVSAVEVWAVEPKLLMRGPENLPGLQLISGTPGCHFLLVVEARKALSAANVALAELLIGTEGTPFSGNNVGQPGVELVSAVGVLTIEPKLPITVQKDLPGKQPVSRTPGCHFLLVLEAREAFSAANVTFAKHPVGAVWAPRVVPDNVGQPGVELVSAVGVFTSEPKLLAGGAEDLPGQQLVSGTPGGHFLLVVEAREALRMTDTAVFHVADLLVGAVRTPISSRHHGRSGVELVSAVRVSAIEPKLFATVEEDLPGLSLISGTPGGHFIIFREAREALRVTDAAAFSSAKASRVPRAT